MKPWAEKHGTRAKLQKQTEPLMENSENTRRFSRRQRSPCTSEEWDEDTSPQRPPPTLPLLGSPLGDTPAPPSATVRSGRPMGPQEPPPSLAAQRSSLQTGAGGPRAGVLGNANAGPQEADRKVRKHTTKRGK